MRDDMETGENPYTAPWTAPWRGLDPKAIAALMREWPPAKRMAVQRARNQARDTYIQRLAVGQAWLTEQYDAFGDIPGRELGDSWTKWCEAMGAWLAMERLVRHFLGVVGHVGQGDACGPLVVVLCDACFAAQGVTVNEERA